jgi:ubiquitin-conjugating enzyme E2 I
LKVEEVTGPSWMTNLERLLAEQENMFKNRKYKFYAIPLRKKLKNGMIRWECGIPGPQNELYEKSYYTIYLDFPKEYPFVPPHALFKYPVYHPNVYLNNQICLDIIGDKWKPSLNVMSVLNGIQQLLDNPNTKSPANTEAGFCFKREIEKYKMNVRENIMKYHRKPEWRGLMR